MKIFLVSAFFALALVVPSGFAQANHPHPCGSPESIYTSLQNDWDESRIGVAGILGEENQAILIEFWASPDGKTFTVLMTDVPKETSCLVLNGVDLELIEPVQAEPAGHLINWSTL